MRIISILIAAIAMFAMTQPAGSQSTLLFVGITAAPPACSHSLNLSQSCNSANLDLL